VVGERPFTQRFARVSSWMPGLSETGMASGPPDRRRAGHILQPAALTRSPSGQAQHRAGIERADMRTATVRRKETRRIDQP